MKRLTFLLALVLFVGVQAVFAQRTVTGTVTSADDGLPIPGATVRVKGATGIGTMTDPDGKYSIDVPNEFNTLVFSFVGMRVVETKIEGTVVNVVMKAEDIGLDEVVVTALGVSREKKSLGYASQGVSSEDITTASNVDPMSSLSGKVAGMQVAGSNFSGSKNILIRGASSFSGNNQPLFVVDGVPISNEGFNDYNTQIGGGGYDYGSMTNDLNSYDIESVEVLKGSAASALYGSRGQNGVIMITTKSGKKGRKSFSVEVNSGVTFEQVSILPKQQNGYGGGYGDFETVNIDGKDYQVVYYGMDESWGPKYENQDVLHWWGITDYEQGLTSTPVTGPWQASPNDVESFYETGVTYQNSVNVITTSDRSALRLGYTNVNMTGIVPNSSQNKHNFNLNGKMSFFEEVVELTTNLNFVDTYTKGRPQFGYGDNSQSQKFFQWGQRQLDMERLKDYKNPDGTNRTWNRVSWSNPTPKYSDNPYWTAYENYQDDDRTRIYGKTGIKLNITDFLNATGNIYMDTYTFNQRERSAVGSQAQSAYHQYQRQATETNTEGKLNFDKNFGDLSVLAMVGGNIRSEQYTRFEGHTDGGLVVAGLYNLNNSQGQPTLDQFLREKRVNSWFGSASFGFMSMAYLDATYRTDYDSSLPVESNSYSYFSTSFSFILSELMDFNWMNNLKLRANYGQTGNGTAPYRVVNTFGFVDPFGGNPQFTNSTSLLNPNLVPEQTSEIEFGVEGAFFDNRFGFDFSYYTRDTENQIVNIETSGATGYTTRVINAGNINNKGIELLAYATPVKVGDFSWDISVNFAKNTNLVGELPEGLDKIQLARAPFGGAYLNAEDGATFQELYAFDYIYDNDGKRVIDAATGFYARTGELTSVGSVLPDFTAGIKNGFTFGGIYLSALVDISQGGKYYSLTNMWAHYAGMAAETVTGPNGDLTDIREDGIVLDGVVADWAVEDDESVTVTNATTNDINISAMDYGAYFYHGFGTPSATSIFDASYIKLREVSLGYTLPDFNDIFQSIRLSVYGRNLATWGLDNEGIDPETVVGGNGNIQGLEGGIVPATRSFGFNLQVKF